MFCVVVLIIFWEVILKILFAETLNLANILVDDSGDHLTSDLFEPLEDVRVKLLRLDGNYAAFPRGLHNGFFRHLSHLQVRELSQRQTWHRFSQGLPLYVLILFYLPFFKWRV